MSSIVVSNFSSWSQFIRGENSHLSSNELTSITYQSFKYASFVWLKSIGSFAIFTSLLFCFLIKISLPNHAQWAPAISSTCYVLECSIDVGWKTEKESPNESRYVSESVGWCRKAPYTPSAISIGRKQFSSLSRKFSYFICSMIFGEMKMKCLIFAWFKSDFSRRFSSLKVSDRSTSQEIFIFTERQSCHFLMLLFQSFLTPLSSSNLLSNVKVQILLTFYSSRNHN